MIINKFEVWLPEDFRKPPGKTTLSKPAFVQSVPKGVLNEFVYSESIRK